MGVFDRLKLALTKSRDKLVSNLKRLFQRREYDESFWEELEETFILSDMGPQTAELLVKELRRELKGIKSLDELWQMIAEKLAERLGEGKIEDGKFSPLSQPLTPPLVVMVLGVNGTGKTSFVVKLANFYKKRGLKPLIGACDTYRAAAINQLIGWASRVGIEVIKQFEGADAAAVAYDAYQAARARGYDLLILDTAGRLHTREELMRELKKMVRVLRKLHQEAPHERLLVLDGTFGLNSIRQTRVFHQEIGTTGLVVTKLDSSSKAGFVFAIKDELNVPIKFVSVGESMDDLQAFEPRTFVKALLDLTSMRM